MRQGRTKTQPQIKDKPDVVPKEDGKLMEELKSCPLDEARKILWYCAQLTDGSHWENQYRRALKAVCDELDRRAAPENKICTDCSGIMYRQTGSGKIIPVDQRCGVKITPPCYQPDGDGCAYQIYGDNNDEPIDRCKACPLCYSDKVRHTAPENKPLTMEQLRQMDGEPVWCVDGTGKNAWCLLDVDSDGRPNAIDKDTGLWDGDFYNMREVTGPNPDKLHVVGWLAYAHRKDS